MWCAGSLYKSSPSSTGSKGTCTPLGGLCSEVAVGFLADLCEPVGTSPAPGAFGLSPASTREAGIDNGMSGLPASQLRCEVPERSKPLHHAETTDPGVTPALLFEIQADCPAPGLQLMDRDQRAVKPRMALKLQRTLDGGRGREGRSRTFKICMLQGHCDRPHRSPPKRHLRSFAS